MKNIYRIAEINKNLQIARFMPLDVLIVGGTGSGKSSTLNALFETEMAAVGRGCDPETMEINSYELNDLMRFWDTPGLGDNIESDRRYAEELIDMLYSDYHLDETQYGLIDTVLVIVDGTSRDMGTTYKLLNEVIVPHFQSNRILVAVNQADMAMKGRHWDHRYGMPDVTLHSFLEEKVESIRNRVWEGTGVNIQKPVYYSAEKGFHVTRLLDLIIDNMPRERRYLME